jgi:transcriptional regulator with PAS, ATPase and Fis domain
MKKGKTVEIADRPKICIATYTLRVGEVLRTQLEAFLGNRVEFEVHPLVSDVCCPIKGDLILVPGERWVGEVARVADRGTPILAIRRTLQRQGWEQVINLPSRTRAMLVNNEQEAAVETVALLYELGARHIQLTAVYPGSPVPNLGIAITPNEMQCVPSIVSKVVNIGDRVIDASTLLDIATRLQILDLDLSRTIAKHYQETVPRNPGLLAILDRLVATRKELELVLDLVQEGIITFDENERIKLFNKASEKLLKKEAWQSVGKTLWEVVPIFPLRTRDHVLDEVYSLGRNAFVVNKAWVEQDGKKTTGVITLRKTEEIQELDAKVRRALRRTGYIAKYSFEDIVGNSDAIRKCVTMAKSIARADGAVLICGESGTGKELFAQAIHNASARARYPFVAINCAALPDSLLESELFGYDEGAFTGAKKGGKPGLFEQAHCGTVFLDEIGDISPCLQAKLLRVLQEKEAMRVGGIGLVPVDVRIISATNKNLLEMVEQGLFRKDLYYRINVLPLTLPTLAQRIDDIPALVSHIMKRKGDERQVSPMVLDLFRRYRWPGNIRELENCIEYMMSMTDADLTVEDVPDYIAKSGMSDSCSNDQSGQNANIEPDVLSVLTKAYQMAQQGKSVGRRSIAAAMQADGIPITEARVRTCIKELSLADYVQVQKGRAGMRITAKGVHLVESVYSHLPHYHQ